MSFWLSFDNRALCGFQRRCVADDMEIHAPKAGLLFDREKVRTVCETFSEILSGGLPHLVVDLVCVSTSGHTLILRRNR